MHNSNNPNTSIPILHIEELTKRYYNVKSKRGHTHRKKYYDVDWRFYIAHKYGQYVLCGTRCPMYDTHNDKWPVISASFASTRDVFEFIGLMIGANKINATLFVSNSRTDSETGCTFTHSDLAFSHPTNARFRALDSDREKRCSELVGYDRFRLSPRSGSSESKVVRLLNIMSVLNSGNMVPFTVSPHPSLRKWQKLQEIKQREQQQQQQQRHQEEQEWQQAEQAECDEYEDRSASSYNANANKCTSSVVPEPAHAHAGDDDATQYDDYYDYIVNDHHLSSER